MDPWLLAVTKELLSCYSPSLEEGNVARIIQKHFAELGIASYFDEAHQKVGGECGNLHAFVEPTAEGRPAILLNAHMDTLKAQEEIVPVVAENRIVSEGKTILGADDKGGIAVILGVLKLLKERSPSHGKVEVMLTIAEEIGLLGAKHADFSETKAEVAYVLDSSGGINEIVLRAPWQDSFKANFRGVSAHSGVEPEKGASAIIAASLAISRMRLGRIDEVSTANIGIIKGGTAPNVVPDETFVEGEARSLKKSECHGMSAEMAEICQKAATECGCSVDVDIKTTFEGYELSKNDPAVAAVVRELEKKGKPPHFISSGGGSDTNVMSSRGMKAVCVGVGAYGVHTENEYLDMELLQESRDVLYEVIVNYGKI